VPDLNGGRERQKRRTRKELLRAASRLLSQGRRPTLDEVAEEALISRATAFRYFPGIEALLVEAALDLATPEPDQLFAGDSSEDPVTRLQRVDAALHDMILANEPALRAMLVHSLQRSNGSAPEGETPVRQNRRSPLIDAALAPVRDQFAPGGLALLTKALALVIGTEGMIVFKDVLQLDDIEARRVKSWMIHALVEAARRKD
jgi:AcrR family transcriptional regulator